MTISTGPGAQPPTTIAALSRKLAQLEAAITRLQINRTPPPRSFGSLSNVGPGMDGSGISDGQTPVFDKASGQYRPGNAGSAYPTLSYQNVPFMASIPVLNQDGGFWVKFDHGQSPPGNLVWGVQAGSDGTWGPRYSPSGTLAVISRLDGAAQINRATLFSVSGPFAGASTTIPWVACWPKYSPSNIVYAAFGSCTAPASTHQGSGDVVCTLPTIWTSEGRADQPAIYHWDVFCGNVACTQWIHFGGSLAIPPMSSYSMSASDVMHVNQIGSNLTIAGQYVHGYGSLGDSFVVHGSLGVEFGNVGI